MHAGSGARSVSVMALNNGATKVAGNVVEALKSQPLVLALLVLNIVFLVFIVWVLREVSQANRARDTQRDKMLSELQESLRICRQFIPDPTRGGGYKLQGEEEFRPYTFPEPPKVQPEEAPK